MKTTMWIVMAGLGAVMALVGCDDDESATAASGNGNTTASTTTGQASGGSGGSASVGGSTTSTGGGMLVDECSDGLDDCDVNATCTDLPEGFECACNMGFTGDGTTCTDDDECALNTDNCDVNATCTNTPGSFMCACNMGYSGNGMTCTDDDECALMTDTCDVNATCTNTDGSFDCTCNTGYSGNGMTCTDDDECALNTDNCDVNATCTNTGGSFTCACNMGYSGNGTTCTDDDECALMTDNCDVNATCANTPGSFTCTCNPPYVGNGVVCTLPPPGETCPVAKVVGALPYSDTDNTALYADNYQTGGGCPTDGGAFGVGAAETVYAFTPSVSGNYGVVINKQSSHGPSLIYVTTDCNSIATTCIADSGDAYGTATDTIAVSMVAGTTYYIMVDGWFANETGTYTLNVLASAPENCTDSIDNDFNGFTDCDDSACATDPQCQPVENLVGCDASFCLFTAGGGPNGGDLCSCNFPGGNHPTSNDLTTGSTCAFFGGGNDMVMFFDMTGYTSFSVETCKTPGDSSLAVYGADPLTLPPQLYCSADATAESSFCSEITDSLNAGPPTATAKPASNQLWIRVDEYTAVNYWNGITTRSIDVELIP